MHTAFSRPSNGQKQYVQHLLRQQGQELRDLILRQGAHVYVCGDASRMAKDVATTIAEILAKDQEFEGVNGESVKYMREMKSTGRWLEDVW